MDEKDIYQALFENSHCSKLLVDKKGIIKTVNKTFTQVFGYSETEILDKHLSILMPEKYKERQGTFFRGDVKIPEQNTKGIVIEVQKKDGTIFFVEMSLNLLHELTAVTISQDLFENLRTELFEKERVFDLATKAAHIGIWSASRNIERETGRLLETFDWIVNDEVKLILGYPENYELTLNDFMAVVHPEDVKLVIDATSNAFKGLSQYNVVYRLNRKDIGLRHIESKGNVLLDENNIPIRLDGVMIDVTESYNTQIIIKESADKLKVREYKYRQLFEKSADSILLLKNGLLIDSNHAAIDLFACEGKDFFLGLHPSDISVDFQENGLDSFDEANKMIEIANQNGTHRFEWTHKKKNGDTFPAEVILTSISEGLIHSVIRDITERKSSELRRAIYNSISQKLNSDISVFNFCEFIRENLKKVIVVSSLYVMLYNEEEKHLTSIFIDDRFIKKHENVNRKDGHGLCEYVISLKQGLRLSQKEYEQIILDQKIRQHRTAKNYWMGAPLMSEANPIGIITVDNNLGAEYSEKDLALLEFIGVQIGRLISRKETTYKLRLLNTTLEERVELRTYELEKAKNEITESLKREKELSNMKSRFVSTASHQFRTPLTVIQTNLGILDIQKNLLDQEFQQKFDKISGRIKKQISKMTSMMDDLLTIGKINERGINFKPTTIDIISLCQKVIYNYDGIQDDNRTVELEVEGDNKIVTLDPVLMEHVLSALISNAFKYSKRCRNPILKIVFLEEELHISVKDFGIGIPKEDIQHIHEPFYRASNVIDIEGTGLGTSIVKEYAELNNGELSIESELNNYTEFKLVFKK